MKLINKIKQFFKKTPEFDYVEYNNQLEKGLQEYFKNNIEYSEQIFYEFWGYIFYKCVLKRIYPTKNEIQKYLKKEISFNEIRDRWQEFEESSKSDEDYERIINNGLL